MKKIFIGITLLALCLVSTVTNLRVHAQISGNFEHIHSFDSHITLHKDDSLTIKETIFYTTGSTTKDNTSISKESIAYTPGNIPHHGIYRDIPLSTVEPPVSTNQLVHVLSCHQ